MTKTRKKPISFRAYPFGIEGKKGKRGRPDKKAWWTVVVHETREELQKAWMGGKEGAENCLGFCHSHNYKQSIDIFGNVTDYPKIRGEMGQIHFWKDELGTQTITHECAHAALYTIMRQTSIINLFQDQENFKKMDEHMACVFASLCCTTVRELYLLKLIES